jgi:hypothetical protein
VRRGERERERYEAERQRDKVRRGEREKPSIILEKE